MKYLLAIDQGTTSTRAALFSISGEPIAQHQIEHRQYFPQNGWVEHDPLEIWQNTITCCQKTLESAHVTANQVAGMGISNQRETTLLWDKETGKAIYPAIVWQDRRTSDFCDTLKQKPGLIKEITQRTGLLIDPYFSATKIHWLLNHVEYAHQLMHQGRLAFGTIDTFLIWHLTDGKSYITDATNASRTLLFNIHTQQWDDDLLKIFDIPREILPKVVDNAGSFGETDADLFGSPIPITGIAGDQQAALIGQACFKSGMVKSTYGTGCFVLLNTGDQVIHSRNNLLSTVAYRLDNKVTFGLEGSIFTAGSAVQWLRDGLGLIRKASETEALASSIQDNGGVYLIPAFTGLGAPYWDPKARGALLGITRDTRVQHIVRATLEAVCYQTRDLLECMNQDGATIKTLRVDGGMVANDWLLHFLSDLLNIEVERPACIETSALGAAYLAGLGAGIYHSLDDISAAWRLNKKFIPEMPAKKRETLYSEWKKAVTLIAHSNTTSD